MSQAPSLDPQTTMGTVTLHVYDLDTMIQYYTTAIPLQVLSHEGATAVLGRGNTPLIVLTHNPVFRATGTQEAGLFHTAILFETEADLASAINSVARHAPHSFTGSADHLVSKAFYCRDPEGNGIELYWDRDPSEWSWVHGEVEMDSIFLDPNTYIQEHLTNEAVQHPLRGHAEIGHVHLSVGSINSAKTFYVDYLGFDATHTSTPGALFVSAGGYHHHMAMNTWNNRWLQRSRESLGIGEIDLVLPSRDAVGDVTERLQHYGVTVTDDGHAIRFDDPWKNTLKVTSSS